jgi:hypothetical protein
METAKVYVKQTCPYNGGRRAVPTIVWPDGSVEVGFRGHRNV